MSPNRTCYLSPTGVALTSSVLGFHQSPVHTTDSENNDDENNDENDYENNDKNDVNNGENNDDDFNLELMPSGDEDEAAQKSENKVTLHQTSAAENVKIAENDPKICKKKLDTHQLMCNLFMTTTVK